MQQLQKAFFIIWWSMGPPEAIPVQFNPTEFTLEKSAQIAEIAIPGLDSPLLQFIRGQNEKLTVDLFFDTTDDGMSGDVTSVTTWTDSIYSMVKIDPNLHAPPVCELVWNDEFPGADIDPQQGNQRRTSFVCIVESVRQKFSLFSPEGVPLRATLTVTLREYRTLDQQLLQLNLTSPDRTHVYALQSGDTLSSVANQFYGQPGQWRHIATASGITDPRRLAPGTFVTVPPIV